MKFSFKSHVFKENAESVTLFAMAVFLSGSILSYVALEYFFVLKGAHLNRLISGELTYAMAVIGIILSLVYIVVLSVFKASHRFFQGNFYYDDNDGYVSEAEMVFQFGIYLLLSSIFIVTCIFLFKTIFL